MSLTSIDFHAAELIAKVHCLPTPRFGRKRNRRIRQIMFTGLLALIGAQGIATATGAEPPAETYDPIVRQIEGWTVKFDPALAADKEQSQRATKALANHLQRVEYIVAEPQLSKMKKLPIWIDKKHKLGNMQYHPDRGWLLANGHDPRLAKHVHIPRAEALWQRGTWIKHPYVVLHELAHAYHDQVLSFDDKRIVSAFNEAKEANIYEQVLLFTGRKVRHYGMSNHKEYFAESTEAYFGVNDFYPFVRAELKEHDPRMFELLAEIWGPLK